MDRSPSTAQGTTERPVDRQGEARHRVDIAMRLALHPDRRRARRALAALRDWQARDGGRRD
jgi:hypothetical protein